MAPTQPNQINTMLVTLTLAYVPSASIKKSVWAYPSEPEYTNFTLIPSNSDEMTEAMRHYDGTPDTMYEKIKEDFESYDGVKAEAEFTFEYVVRDGFYPIQNSWEPKPHAKLRVRSWRLKSGPAIDNAFYCRTHSCEYSFGCTLLRQLNNTLNRTLSLDKMLQERLRGRYIANVEGQSIIQRSNMLRRCPTIKGPENCGNPLIINQYNDIEEEVDYDRVYEYYYGMYGSKEYGKQERDDQDAVATFPE
uniref:Uncharacterized protein n=1 Tax=viral metagenome TaxID=1070528 RepID=A0A6C0F208_9ZZZZ